MKNVVCIFVHVYWLFAPIILIHSQINIKAQDKGAECIQDGDESYFCVCPEGFGGDPHHECKQVGSLVRCGVIFGVKNAPRI